MRIGYLIIDIVLIYIAAYSFWTVYKMGQDKKNKKKGGDNKK